MGICETKKDEIEDKYEFENGYKFEYEPQVKSRNSKIKIILETTNTFKVMIIIDPEKTVTELIKFYFQKIKKPELFGDPSINFLTNAKILLHNSKNLIKEYINKESEINKIIIVDPEYKIQNRF